MKTKPEILTYKQLFKVYAKQAGLRKPLFIHSPAFPFKLGKKIAQFIAKLPLPISPDISQPLLDGLGVEIITKDGNIRKITLACEPDEFWFWITRIGGSNGWYYGDIL